MIYVLTDNKPWVKGNFTLESLNEVTDYGQEKKVCLAENRNKNTYFATHQQNVIPSFTYRHRNKQSPIFLVYN